MAASRARARAPPGACEVPLAQRDGPASRVPSVAYENRTSRSPAAVSSSSTRVVNRRSPARWGTATSSRLVAFPQGVVIVAMRDNVVEEV